jgi:glycine/D-amino acid oxidase-like deaminating enzyme
MVDVRSKSLWLDTFAGSLDPRPALGRDLQCDVAIIGGGFTGLWTAHALSERDPSLRIVVLEREVCGFGASGRNGGWAEGELAGSLEKYAAQSSMPEALRQVRAMFATVDEMRRVIDAEGIDCGFARGGAVRVARNDAQARRQRAEIEHHRDLGLTEEEVRLLDADAARAMCNASEVRGGIFLSACASVDPARLVRGLADACERRGITIHEQTEVTAIQDRRVTTNHRTVRADVVVRATEAYTRDLPGERRTLIPIYSLMVATAPLPDEVFDEIGLAGRPTFADDRYMVVYGQRTEDNRLAFGGRSVPYAFGSAIRTSLEQRNQSHEQIARSLRELFPVIGDAEITHRWGGVLGAPRNWMPSVQFDPSTGFATAGGYVGEGVAAANLAGRTLADLIVGNRTELTTLPWVGVRSRKWEPEPFRWIGVRGARSVLGVADKIENRNRGDARWAERLSRVLRG